MAWEICQIDSNAGCVETSQPGSAEEVMRMVASASYEERVQAAIVLSGRGDIARLKDSVALAALDWRDVLMRADLGYDDWAVRLDRELGPATAS